MVSVPCPGLASLARNGSLLEKRSSNWSHCCRRNGRKPSRYKQIEYDIDEND